MYLRFFGGGSLMAEASADVGRGRDLRLPLPRVLGSASGHRELEPWQREIFETTSRTRRGSKIICQGRRRELVLGKPSFTKF